MQSSEQKSGPPVEGSTFAEYPPTKSDNGIKSKESSSLDTGYTSSKIEQKPSKEGATFAEYKPTESVGLKSTIKPQNEDDKKDTAYTSAKIQQKESKEGSTFGEYPMTASVGIKSTTVNTSVASTSVNPKPNLTASTGYNSMEGEYTSTTKIESKPSNEGATFAEYKSTESVGIKSTIQTQPNNNLQQKSSIEGSLFEECPMSVSVNASQTQPTVIKPLIIQVPSNAPILNTSLPTGNIQTSYIVTTTTTQQVLNPIPINNNNIQPIQPIQPMQPIQPIQTGQPLAGSTFATYPMTTSHGIKSSGVH
jgi:hypothetical protein